MMCLMGQVLNVSKRVLSYFNTLAYTDNMLERALPVLSMGLPTSLPMVSHNMSLVEKTII